MNDRYVVVIGGANMDIAGKSSSKLNLRSSNPGKISYCAGGVARNIAENLSRLGTKVKLLTAIGDDEMGRALVESCEIAQIDVSKSITVNNEHTSTYMSILDEDGDMHIAISDMAIVRHIDPNYISSNHKVIAGSIAIVVDGNLSIDTLKQIIKDFTIPIFMDPVSSKKAVALKSLLSGVHTFKPNLEETELLLDLKIRGVRDVRLAGKLFIEMGIKQVFISMGSKGLYYTDGKVEEHFEGSSIKVINATGAGDAMMASIVYGYINDLSAYDTARMAMAAAEMALEHYDTINPAMNIENINKKVRNRYV